MKNKLQNIVLIMMVLGMCGTSCTDSCSSAYSSTIRSSGSIIRTSSSTASSRPASTVPYAISTLDLPILDLHMNFDADVSAALLIHPAYAIGSSVLSAAPPSILSTSFASIHTSGAAFAGTVTVAMNGGPMSRGASTASIVRASNKSDEPKKIRPR